MSRELESNSTQDRIRLIISGGCLLDPTIPPGTFKHVGNELKSLYGNDCLEDDEILQELGWLDENGDAIFPNAPFLLKNLTFDVAYTRPRQLLERLGQKASSLGLFRVPGFVPGALFDHVAYEGSAEELEMSLHRVGIDAEVRAHYFTRDEHAVLSAYLEQWPAEARESLGTDSLPNEILAAYADQLVWSEDGDSIVEGAVAAILLRSIHKELPWCVGTGFGPESGVRWKRPRRGSTLSSILPIHLLTINWATSGPGVDWPESYYLSWVPIYDLYVVTVSADSEETLRGPVDLAIHSFAADGELMSEVKAALVSDWEMWRGEFEQDRWEDVRASGLVDREQAEKWANEVWCDEEEDEWEEDDECSSSDIA